MLGTSDKSVILWDIKNWKEIKTFKAGRFYYITSVAFSPDGKYALSGADIDPQIKLWNIKTGKEIIPSRVKNL